jgi:DNA-binding CsgD family transcriptional regulator
VVAYGRASYHAEMMAHAEASFSDDRSLHGLLTPREFEVLHRTATGRTNADVAADLGVSVHAVKFHLASIFRKLQVHNRTEAAAWYLAAGRRDALE